jgi:hypothetical protein
MGSEINGIRPAVLDDELYESFIGLRGFRHLVWHRYGIEPKPLLVEEDLVRMNEAFPRFLHAIKDLSDYMLGQADDSEKSNRPL